MLAKEDIGYFAYHYLDMDIPYHQRNWFELLDSIPRLVLLSPRDHGKTTSVCRVYVEHKSLFIPNHRTLLFSKSGSQSIKSLKTIIADLTKNVKIKRDFRDELESFRKFKNQVWLNIDKTQRDATIEADGLMGSITGGHFDTIISDDLQDEENTRTSYQISMVQQWFNGTVTPLLEPEGNMAVVGTRKVVS